MIYKKPVFLKHGNNHRKDKSLVCWAFHSILIRNTSSSFYLKGIEVTLLLINFLNEGYLNRALITYREVLPFIFKNLVCVYSLKRIKFKKEYILLYS